MSFSEPKNEPRDDLPCDLPLLVFTNSRDDYGVTVRVPPDAPPDRMQRTTQWIDALARRCDTWFARGGATLVEVVPSPDRPDHALAVRVFDVGEFRGRSHTLAIVAVELPPDWLAERSVARLLAALGPPVPDAAQYQLPTGQQMEASPIGAEPFASLAAWERTARQIKPMGPAFFSQPAEIAQELNRLNRQLDGDKSSRRRRLMIIAIISAVISSAVLAAAVFTPG
jgi:hypothetical protein